MIAQSESVKEIASALSKLQAFNLGARKDAENPHFKNAFASLESIWAVIREPMTASGLSITQHPSTDAEGVSVATRLFHVSGEWMESTLRVPLVKKDAQSMGSAISYAKRYALLAIVGAYQSDEDDGEAAVGRAGGWPSPLLLVSTLKTMKDDPIARAALQSYVDSLSDSQYKEVMALK